jgi:hypothetical protein
MADSCTDGKEYSGSTTTELEANFIMFTDEWKRIIRKQIATDWVASSYIRRTILYAYTKMY